jgi:hypothetical protein
MRRRPRRRVHRSARRGEWVETRLPAGSMRRRRSSPAEQIPADARRQRSSRSGPGQRPPAPNGRVSERASGRAASPPTTQPAAPRSAAVRHREAASAVVRPRGARRRCRRRCSQRLHRRARSRPLARSEERAPAPALPPEHRHSGPYSRAVPPQGPAQTSRALRCSMTPGRARQPAPAPRTRSVDRSLPATRTPRPRARRGLLPQAEAPARSRVTPVPRAHRSRQARQRQHRPPRSPTEDQRLGAAAAA